MNLGDLIRRASTYHPEKLACVFKDVRLTYKELNVRVNSLANALLRLGISKQDRVGILSYNSNCFEEVFFAVAKIGAVTVTINWRLSPREISYVINDSEAKIVFVGEQFIDKLTHIKSELSSVKKIVCIGRKIGDAISYEQLIESAQAAEPQIDTPVDEVVWQIYTSGTTGPPKGVLLSHRNILADCEHNIIGNRLNRDNAIHLQVYQMFHIPMKRIIYTTYIVGTTVFLERFDVDRLCQLIEREKVTDLGMAPAMWESLMNYPGISRYDLSSLKYASYSTMPMPRSLVARLIERFPNIIFFSTYGLTEAGSSLTILPASDHVLDGPEWLLRRLKSVGRPMMGVDVRIVDEQGRDCPVCVAGEIIARGDNIMQGYWKLPRETAEAIKDGWLYTGDIGYWDDRGYIYLVDRKKDMIVSGGENIYSCEVENVIYELEDVVEVAVIGVPDPKWGEAVKAMVVKAQGSALTENDVIDHCVENIASYKKPKSVDFVKSLPRTCTGKLVKKVLKDKFWRGTEGKI